MTDNKENMPDKEVPQVIYLQYYGDGEPDEIGEVSESLHSGGLRVCKKYNINDKLLAEKELEYFSKFIINQTRETE